MKLSARKIISGTVTGVTKGATTAHVETEIAPGRKVTASISKAAADELGLAAGKSAHAAVKASAIMVAVD